MHGMPRSLVNVFGKPILKLSFQRKDFTKFYISKLIGLEQLCFLKNYVLVNDSAAYK